MSALFGRPVVEQIIGKARLVLPVVYAVVIVMLPQVVDPQDAALSPFSLDGFRRHSVGQHMHMNAVCAFPTTEICKDHGVGVIVFQSADVTVPNLFRFREGMYLVRVVER